MYFVSYLFKRFLLSEQKLVVTLSLELSDALFSQSGGSSAGESLKA